MKKLFLLLTILFTFLSSHAQNNILELLDVNKIKVHISNHGYIGNHLIGPNIHKGAVFENMTFLYAGGFYIAGYSDNSLWGNGIFPSIEMRDYLPGNVDADPDDTKFKIYVVRTTDPVFGDSWQEWKTAVELGAYFYDGDRDGIYDPVDLNGNGKWDKDEDKPDIIGDYTAWSVFNDSKPKEERIFQNTSPKGIEIKQTVFAWDSTHNQNLSNTFFVRYIIENRGKFYDSFDSVYFGIATDPDLGEAYWDDFAGTDTSLNAGYAYKKEPDSERGYGDNPPSFYSALLQGPHKFIPGETFIDNNGNGIYDDGTDIPLDSAVVNRGPFLQKKYIAGAKNLKMTSATHPLKSSWEFDDPENERELMNYLIGGMYPDGSPIIVKDFYYGNGADLGAEADEIPPNYLFSGNPVDSTGWLTIGRWDFRLIVSSGPFNLKVGEPVEIIAAYIVGRGDNPLNSVTVTKNITENIIQFYDNNFSFEPVSVEESKAKPSTFYLNQNYPNPFNPSTIIKYSLNQPEFVSLKVFDVLGREITTLVNEQKQSGDYSIEFDASILLVFYGKINQIINIFIHNKP